MEHLEIHYNPWIVALSFVIAVLASYSALNLSSKIFRTAGKERIIWLLAGSCVMGCGVWSMHFVGMLAVHLQVPVHYDPTLTVLSALASIAASFIAFYVNVAPQPGVWRLAFGGLFMGSGIVIMHYTRMSAMHTSVAISYEPILWTASVVIALAASYAALYLFRKFRSNPQYSRWKLLSSLVMGVAIGGMHYTGMAATRFHYEGEVGLAHPGAQTDFFLLAGVSVVTFLILGVSLVAVFVDRHLLEQMAFHDSLTNLPNRYGLPDT